MKRHHAPFLFLAILLSLTIQLPSNAAIVYSGDIDPDDPNTWTFSTDGYIGKNSTGTVAVDGGSDLRSRFGYLGRYSGSTGTATVNGTGSTWTNSSVLWVGYSDSGTLNIEAGGQVSSSSSYLGYWFDSTGTATVAGVGSTWTNSYLYVGLYGSGTLTVSDGGVVTAETLWASLSDLYGNGTITTKSAVLDADLIFDATHGSQQTLAFGTGGTLNLDSDGTGSWGAGYKSEGTLRIADGVTVAGSYGYLGYRSGSTGTATVTGAGSTWTHLHSLYVGRDGSGTLNIEAGGQVSNGSGYLGYVVGSTGTATVTGDGSTWINHGDLYVGDNDSGTLNITDCGVVLVEDTLTIDDDGDGDGFINMASGGMLALAGNADDSLIDFYDLIDGTDAIRWWDPAVADWNLLTTATMGEDYTLAYINDGSELDGYTLLTVMAIEPGLGDANCDGQVDGSDATILANYWQHGVGMTSPDATWSMGDFNGDHVVDGSDATLLASHWQEGTPPSSAVPEPGCVVLMLTLLAAGFGVMSRKRR